MKDTTKGRASPTNASQRGRGATAVKSYSISMKTISDRGHAADAIGSDGARAGLSHNSIRGDAATIATG